MIARVEDTTQGFIIAIPPEYVKAWNLRQDFPLEVHRVGSTHERDEPGAIEALHARALEINEETMRTHEAAFRELAKGPEGVGPHDKV